MVDERSNVAPVWMATVRDAVEKFKGASVEEQEVICVSLGEKCAPEAAAMARKLFAARPVEAKPWIRQFPKKPSVAAKPQPKAEPKPKKVGVSGKEPTIGWPKEWPEAPKAPADVRGFERLLYPPGLLGHAVQ